MLVSGGVFIGWYITFTANTAFLHILDSILILSVLVSTLYWLVLFIKISLFKETISYGNFGTCSILISAKNEADNLKKLLPKLLKQNDFKEIVVMNDYSDDSTLKVLQSISKQNDKLISFSPSKDLPGKKLALTEGIDHCSSETILLTDADCYPVSDRWASIMASKIRKGAELVLGYGPLEKTSGILNAFARYETVITAVQYFGFSLYNKAYMGVGRNMAFTKKLFKTTNGYSSHEHIPSGDDDLFVQDACKLTDVQICLDPESFMYSTAPEDLKSYIHQKKRHIATSTSYNTLHKMLLSVHPFFHLIAAVLSVVFIMLGNFKIIAFVWLIRWSVLMIMAYLPFRRLSGIDLIKWIPLMDILLVGYYIYFGWSALDRKNASW